MRVIPFALLIVLMAFSISCDRSPDRAIVSLRFNGVGAPNGIPQSVTLPGSFQCFALAVHQSSDTDGSHCQDAGGNQFNVTSIHGPILIGANNVLTLSLIAETVTFNLFAVPSIFSSICSSTSPTNLSAFVNQSDRLILNQAVTLNAGANTVNLSVNNSSGNALTGCQGVTNFN